MFHTKGISSILMPYAVRVMERDKIPYRITGQGEKGWDVEIDCPHSRFREIIRDAQCEKQSDGYISQPLVVSMDTYQNKGKMKRLLREKNKRGFIILKKDEAEFASKVRI